MSRLAIVFCVSMLVGCSGAVPDTPANGAQRKFEDGGPDKNVQRDKAEGYFMALRGVQSVDEEKQLLTEFGQWLTESGYKIQVEENDGRHKLSCPYFPPVTPWTEHAFYDIQNLQLLPLLEDGD